MKDTGVTRRDAMVAAAGVAVAALGRRARAGAHRDKDRFVADIREALREVDAQAAVAQVLQRAVAAPGDLMEALGPPAGAGIHALYNDARLTVLNVVWAPLMVLLPHDHNMWATIGIYTGREDNIIWQRAGTVIEARSATALSARQVLSLPHDAIHSVINPIARLTGAIHVYGGDFFASGRSEWDAATLEQRPFDLERAQRTFREADARFARTPLTGP